MDKTITKKHIAANIAKEVGISKSESVGIVNNIIEGLVKVTKETGRSRIYAFGNFTTHQKTTRMGRNPKTKEEYCVPARRIITFKPSNMLKDFINDSY
jgi:integration host factor subunit alpha